MYQIDELIFRTNQSNKLEGHTLEFVRFSEENHLQIAVKLIEDNLSEPYSLYTYRYFTSQWPQFFYLAKLDNEFVGVIISKLNLHHRSYDTLFGNKKQLNRGYIAMLAVDKNFRNLRIGYKLVQLTIEAMKIEHADEIALEADSSNISALNLYRSFGFLVDKSMENYYYGGMRAYRLKLWLPNQEEVDTALKV
ncbi:hypothetical protein BB561_006411 [Smittium simulii]|uniref:N-acetyltransferase domain-containing protein n=1 Tax=Smittium simulii TaxID=133385 RepID=A0A2T9Y4K9_9FUNG|nr:hypothetical protein BB561_006411 [Smittium simulii]